MNDKKYMPLKIIHVICLAAALILSIVAFAAWITIGYENNTLTQGNTLASLISCGIGVIGLGSGILYFVSGYKKNAAGLYKVFSALLALATLITMISFMLGSANLTIPLIGFAVSLVCILALTFVKNLGRQKSYIIYGVLLVITAAMLIGVIMRAMGGGFGDHALGVVSGMITQTVMVVTLGMMVIEKYIDKKQRNTI